MLGYDNTAEGLITITSNLSGLISAADGATLVKALAASPSATVSLSQVVWYSPSWHLRSEPCRTLSSQLPNGVSSARPCNRTQLKPSA